MDNEQLNKLAISAQQGSDSAYHEILRHFLPKISRISESIWYLVVNETHFEQSCIVGIKDAIKRFDQSKGAFSTQVNFHIRQAKSRSISRLTKRRRGYEMDYLDKHSSGDEERSSNYEVVDDLAVIDDGIIVNEKIALLAEDDSRKLAILNAWSNGEYNDSDTASFLAKRYGGNSESHRKFINRFRTTCRGALA